MRRALSFLFLVFGASAAAVSLGAPMASAHNTFEDSSPAAGESLATSPTTWTVRFTKSVPLVSASGSVVDGDGTRTTLNPPRHGDSDNVLVFDLPVGLSGDVTARWRLVSTDGHVISGRVGFAVAALGTATSSSAAPLPGATAVPVPSSGPTEVESDEVGVPEPVRVALRTLNYLAIVLLGGIVFVDLDIAGGVIATQRGRRIVLWGAGGVAIVPLLQFLVFAGDIRIEGEAFGGALGDALSLTPGAMLLLRSALGGIIALIARAVLVGGPIARPPVQLILGTSAMYLVSLAYVGHSRSQAWPVLGIPVDVAHTAAIAVWLGGLVVMLLVVVPAVAPAVAVTAFHRFGGAAQVAVSVIAVTGVVQTVRLHPSVSTLLTSSHGLLLLGKIALVGAMIRLAARNRKVLARHAIGATADDRRAREVLVRTTLSEVGMGLAVIVLTAVLVAVTPG